MSATKTLPTTSSNITTWTVAALATEVESCIWSLEHSRLFCGNEDTASAQDALDHVFTEWRGRFGQVDHAVRRATKWVTEAKAAMAERLAA